MIRCGLNYVSVLSIVSVIILKASSCAIDGNRRDDSNIWHDSIKLVKEVNNTRLYKIESYVDKVNKYGSQNESNIKSVISNNKTKNGNIKLVRSKKTKNGNKKKVVGKIKYSNQNHNVQNKIDGNKLKGMINKNLVDRKKHKHGNKTQAVSNIRSKINRSIQADGNRARKNGNNKKQSNKRHEDSTSRYGDGIKNVYRRGDGYFAPAPKPGEAIGEIDQTESWADLVKKLTTASSPGGDKYEQRTTGSAKRRTTPLRVSFEEDCDYLAYYCMKAYKTGKLCGRTLYYYYETFDNYCMLDYVNCMERYEVWQVTHMGECFTIKRLQDYQHYEYQDDSFLDRTYVIQE